MTASIHAERVTYVASLTDAEPVTQVMGNGRRTIVPITAEVTAYPNGVRSVVLDGRQILRSGERGSHRQVGWTIGGRWGSSAGAPQIVHDLIAWQTAQATGGGPMTRLSDARVTEIRARLAEANDDIGIAYSIPADEWHLTCDKPTMQALRHAPADLADLLAERETLLAVAWAACGYTDVMDGSGTVTLAAHREQLVDSVRAYRATGGTE